MSKRKAIAGGYEDSGDDSDLELTVVEPSIKKVKSAPLVVLGPAPTSTKTPPPFSRSPSLSLLTTATPVGSLRSASVQIGSSRGATSVSAPTTSKALAPEAVQHSSMLEEDTLDYEQEDTYTPNLDDSNRQKPVLRVHTEGLSTQFNKPRSTMTMERELHKALTKFEEYQQTWEQKHQQTEDKLTKLLQAVELLTPTNISPAHGPSHGAPSPAAQMNSAGLVVSGEAIPWRYSHLSNPPPPPGFLDLVTDACDPKITRPEYSVAIDNAIKDHVRKSYTSVLRIKRIKDVGPYFVDQHGKPDTLPEHFVNPETNYGLPCPHFAKALTKQIDWIPTWLEWCKGTVPIDTSEISMVLRSLTDEEWVSYLYFGPFKSAQQVWRATGKSEEELKKMRESRIMYYTTERKSFQRLEYVNSIPTLRGSQYEFICHRGYMSEEEEENGVTIVKRPSHRCSLLNNLFDAIAASETRKRLKARPGSTVKPRQIKIIDVPIPQLERTNDKKKATVQIAAWALAKRWKDQNGVELSKAARLINTTFKLKPDISTFLGQNPVLSDTELSGNSIKIEKVEPTDEVASINDPRSDGTEQSQDEGGEYDGAYGIRAQSHDLVDLTSLSTLNAEGSTAPHDRNTLIPIDPRLLDADNQDDSNVTATTLQANTLLVPSFEPPADTAALVPVQEPASLGDTPTVGSTASYSPSNPSMPPPPPLQPVVETDRHVPTEKNEEERLGEIPASGPRAPVKRGRGRPRGSKNKPKAVVKD